MSNNPKMVRGDVEPGARVTTDCPTVKMLHNRTGTVLRKEKFEWVVQIDNGPAEALFHASELLAHRDV